jgi:hypothetical protein
MTIHTHNTHNIMSNLTVIEQGLLAAPSEVYEQLLSESFFQTYILHSTLSLTLTNNMVRAIVNTRNSKFRRKSILAFCAYLHTQTISLPYYLSKRDTNHFVYLVYVLITQLTIRYNISKYSDNVTVRLLNIDNSPWYTAVQIGDSKHYTSCLRSDVLSVDATKLTEDDWTAIVKNDGCEDGNPGCNSHYIEAEVRAFTEGRLVYVGVGTLPHEGGNGFESRVRVHVLPNTTDGESVCVVDRLYGQTSYLPLLINKLREHFDIVCSNTTVYTKTMSFDTTTRIPSRVDLRGAYSDYTFGTLYRVLDAVSVIPFRRSSLNTYTIQLHDGSTVYCNSSELQRLQDEAYSRRLASSRNYYINVEGRKQYVDYTVTFVICYLCRKYKQPISILDNVMTCDWIQHGNLITLGSANTLAKWRFRNHKYEIRRYYLYDNDPIVLLTRINTGGSLRESVYNVRTGQWVVRTGVTNQFIASEYQITKHTIYTIDKFLPKNTLHFLTHG